MSGHTSSPFSNAFRDPTIGSLRYNTAQYGSPIPICYGTCRCTINVLEFFDFKGTKGANKGGKGFGGGTGKKSGQQSYTVNVAMGICQGPVDVRQASYGANGWNRVWSNGGISYFDQVQLAFYNGFDGPAPDGTFESSSPNQPAISYSGTCYIVGAPMQLGQTPALPNAQVEISGFLIGTAGPNLPDDARPDLIIIDMLTNPRYGAGFPYENLDVSGSISDYGNFCQAGILCMSLLMDRQQPAARWIEEIAQLTYSVIVWSGNLLKIIPYWTAPLANNGTSWAPNLTIQYYLTDADFISFGGETDPVVITRADPAAMTNWLSMEYYEKGNSYNTAMVEYWDQGLIDRFGLRTEASVTGHEFTNGPCAQASVVYQGYRKSHLRNTYKFKLGFKFHRLEPMDIVSLNDYNAGLSNTIVRVTQIEEDDNWELTVTAEELPGVTI